MAARRLDGRFLLPGHPRTVVVVGDLPGVSEELVAAGLEEVSIATASAAGADLAIAPADLAEQALAVGARTTLFEGPAAQVSTALTMARRSGLSTRCLLPLPGIDLQHLVPDLAHRVPAAYAMRMWAPTGRRPTTRLKLKVISRLVQAGAMPPVGARIGTAVSPEPLPPGAGRPPSRLPAILGAAVDLGLVAPNAGWFASFPSGPDRKRCAFVVFQPGAPEPEVVVKFARLRGAGRQFDRDEQGLALAAATGGCVSAVAQRLLARFEVAGHQASVETAALGSTLERLLARPQSRRRKVALVDAVAGWLLQVARQTVGTSEGLEPERRRLVLDVLAISPQSPPADECRTGLGGVPAVFEHGDVSQGNVVFDGHRLALVDWELARFPGFPLWDLLYFALCALPLVDGVTDEGDQDRHFLALFEGRAPSSSLLFGWIRSAVDSLGLQPRSVGWLTTMCWLHWCELLRRIRREQGRAEPPLPVERAARLWLTRPGLGPGWDHWRHGASAAPSGTSNGSHPRPGDGGLR